MLCIGVRRIFQHVGNVFTTERWKDVARQESLIESDVSIGFQRPVSEQKLLDVVHVILRYGITFPLIQLTSFQLYIV